MIWMLDACVGGWMYVPLDNALRYTALALGLADNLVCLRIHRFEGWIGVLGVVYACMVGLESGS